MKTENRSKLFLIIFISASVFLYGGCGKKVISPYAPITTGNNMIGHDAGHDENLGRGIIMEEFAAIEEPLDTVMDLHDLLPGRMVINADQQSEEHKKRFGRSSMAMQPIYFDFDKSNIRTDMITRMEHNGEYLKRNFNFNLVVEGNTDQRGTREYNLALGERRAMSAKNYLIELGVRSYRIRTLSYGEERPLFKGQTEFDFAQNRRADFILE